MKTYLIEGNPVPLARGRFGGGKVYDSQKGLKLIAAMALRNQHNNLPLYSGAVCITAQFFMPIPKASQPKSGKPSKLEGKPHIQKPDLDNLLKWVCDISSGILYHDDAIVWQIMGQKFFDTHPRTEITIWEQKSEIATVKCNGECQHE